MKKITLIDTDYAILDPYGSLRDRLTVLRSACDKHEEPSQFWKLSPQESFDRYNKLLSKLTLDAHRAYLEYNEEMKAKYAPQGGSIRFSSLEDLLLKYYTAEGKRITISKHLKRGRDILIRIIKSRLEKDGYPQYIHDPVRDTFAGSPTALKKGDYLAETLGAKPWRHVRPLTPNVRRMRNSDRVIFEDSILNVRLVEDYLTSCREWLKKELPQFFNGWLDPKLFTRPMLTRSVMNPHMTHVEWDYIKMDQNFILPIVTELLFPIYEVLNPDGFLQFAATVEELFSAPLFMGTELWTGIHSLFSGQGFTNDFETLYSIILVLAVLSALNYDLSTLEVAAIGDDITLPLICSDEFAKAVLDMAIDISNQAGMFIHDDEKSRISRSDTRFCRHVYYPRAARDENGIMLGAYPSILALNNIVQPEKPDFKAADNCLSTLQRTDNVQGSPEYVPFVQFVQKYSTLDLTWLPTETRKSRRDWFEKVYGVRWDPAFSPTYHLLANFNKNAVSR